MRRRKCPNCLSKMRMVVDFVQTPLPFNTDKISFATRMKVERQWRCDCGHVERARSVFKTLTKGQMEILEQENK